MTARQWERRIRLGSEAVASNNDLGLVPSPFHLPESLMAGANDDLTVPVEEFVQDPYPYYHRLRARAPVFWDERAQAWILTRYADVAAVLRDPRFLTIFPFGSNDPRFRAYRELMERWMVHRNPPDHTRLRALVNKAFLPRVIDQLRPHIEQVVNRMLDSIQSAGRMDLVAEFAHPIPVAVITRMLGVPVEDDEQFSQWTEDLVAGAEPSDLTSDAILERANLAAIAFDRYFRHLIDLKRARPTDDLLSGLISVEDQGSRLSTEELVAMGTLLLFAGHETTVNLIGNGTLSLLRNPDQLALVRSKPALIKLAVEEFLRYESSFQLTFRKVAEDVQIGGQMITRGSVVHLALGAANRDPEVFPEPDRLDVTRAENKHLAFGAGIHYCIGAPLARVEAQIAIAALIIRFTNLRLATDRVEWQPLVGARALKSLPVSF